MESIKRRDFIKQAGQAGAGTAGLMVAGSFGKTDRGVRRSLGRLRFA